MRAVCLQYVPFEGPGAFASALMRSMAFRLNAIWFQRKGFLKILATRSA